MEIGCMHVHIIFTFRCFVLNSCYQNVKMYLMDYCFIFLFRYFTPMTKCVLSTVHSCFQSHSALNMLLFNVVVNLHNLYFLSARMTGCLFKLVFT